MFDFVLKVQAYYLIFPTTQYSVLQLSRYTFPWMSAQKTTESHMKKIVCKLSKGLCRSYYLILAHIHTSTSRYGNYRQYFFSMRYEVYDIQNYRNSNRGNY